MVNRTVSSNPSRHYQALELELDKRYSNHWLAVVNYRMANLWGNYEGAYRNDNNQSDPGISSLFDFTAGKLNLLGDQFKPGYLSTDRRAVGNLFLSYTVGADSRFVSFAKGLTGGVGVRGQSGVPISFLGDHPAYFNQGEVPIGGRGAAGRTPSSVQIDGKAEYDLSIHEGKVLKLGLDAFNSATCSPLPVKSSSPNRADPATRWLVPVPPSTQTSSAQPPSRVRSTLVQPFGSSSRSC